MTAGLDRILNRHCRTAIRMFEKLQKKVWQKQGKVPETGQAPLSCYTDRNINKKSSPDDWPAA